MLAALQRSGKDERLLRWNLAVGSAVHDEDGNISGEVVNVVYWAEGGLLGGAGFTATTPQAAVGCVQHRNRSVVGRDVGDGASHDGGADARSAGEREQGVDTAATPAVDADARGVGGGPFVEDGDE